MTSEIADAADRVTGSHNPRGKTFTLSRRTAVKERFPDRLQIAGFVSLT
jgi:hypothetical protein